MLGNVRVVHTRIARLFDRAFLSLSRNVRKEFQPIFRDERCFKTLRHLVHEPGTPLPRRAPFIKGLGPVIVDPRRLVALDHLPGTNKAYRRFLDSLNAEVRDEFRKLQPYAKNFGRFRFLGFDPGIDHRMNYVHFELANPPRFRGAGRFRAANGTVFVHFYPPGYVVASFVASLPRTLHQGSSFAVQDFMDQTDPEASPLGVEWETEGLGKTPAQIMDSVLGAVAASVYEDAGETLVGEGRWRAVEVHSDLAPASLRTLVPGFDPEEHPLSGFLPATNLRPLKDPSRLYGLVAEDRLLCNVPPELDPAAALFAFQKAVFLFEIAALERVMLRQYRQFLAVETERLLARAFSLWKLRPELMRCIRWDRLVHAHRRAMEDHRHDADGVHAALLKIYADRVGVVAEAERVQKVMQEWEAELRVTRHPLVWLAARLFGLYGAVKGLA